MKRPLLFSAALLASMAGMAQSAGDYYLQNAATGQFLNGANSWGTKASLTYAGQLMTLAGSDGVFTIDSHISNGGNSHFVGAGENLYVDSQPAQHTFEACGDGYYAISDGSKYLVADEQGIVNFKADEITPAAKWKLVSPASLRAQMNYASDENPTDVSSLIFDYSFGRNNQYFDKWSGGPARGGANENFCAEKFNCTFDVNQTLSDMPVGRYKLKVQGFYRPGGAGNKDDVQNAIFYANETEKGLRTLGSESNCPDGVDYDGVKLPNSMGHASNCFSAGLYENELEFTMDQAGTITVGVKKSEGVDWDWTIFDNFRLFYYGMTPEQFMATFQEEIDAANAIDLTQPHEASVGASFEATLAKVNGINLSGVSVDDLRSLKTELGEAVGEIKASMEKYAGAQAVFDKYDGNAELYDETANRVYYELTASVHDSFKAGVLDFATYEGVLKNAYITAVKLLTEPQAGCDVTPLIENYDFSTGNTEGWVYESSDAWSRGYQGASYANGDVKISQFVELWIGTPNTVGDGYIHQTLSGLPDGIYTLGADVIASYQADASLEVTGVTLLGEGLNKGYAALSTGNGAPQTFTTTEFVVYGGTATVGVDITGANANWIAADNFKLTYVRPYSASDISQVMDDQIEVLEDLMSEYHAKEIRLEAKEVIREAQRLDDDATMEEIGEMLNKLYTVQVKLERSVAEYAAAEKAIEDAIAYMNENYADAAASFQSEVDPMFKDLYSGTLNIDTYKEELSAARTRAIISTKDMDEEEVDLTDVITNPAFAGNGNGWDGLGNKDKAFQYQAAQYTNDEVTINGFMERWVPGAALSASTLSQTIYGLPKGVYLLKADVIACRQGAEESAVNVNLFINDTKTACATNNEAPETFEALLILDEDNAKVVIGVEVGEETNANWVAVDNFRLLYGEKLADGVAAVEVVGVKPEAVYNLAGQRLTKMQKGINIVNGKKVIK